MAVYPEFILMLPYIGIILALVILVRRTELPRWGNPMNGGGSNSVGYAYSLRPDLYDTIQPMSKTALALSPEQWQRYQPTKVRDTTAEQQEEDSDRIKRAWEVARLATQRLREEFQAERVVLFGSLVHAEEFTPWSDIDLAAWGIPAERFYAAVALVTGLSPDFKVDLIDPDTCRPALKTAIDRDGVEL